MKIAPYVRNKVRPLFGKTRTRELEHKLAICEFKLEEALQVITEQKRKEVLLMIQCPGRCKTQMNKRFRKDDGFQIVCSSCRKKYSGAIYGL